MHRSSWFVYKQRNEYKAFCLLPIFLVALVGCQKSPQTALEAANDHFLHGRYEQALQAADQALADTQTPEKQAEVHLLRGRTLVDMYALASNQPDPKVADERLRQAIDAFSQSIDLHDNVEARYMRSMAYKLAGNADLSMQDARIARQNDPNRGLAYQNESSPILLDLLESNGSDPLQPDAEDNSRRSPDNRGDVKDHSRREDRSASDDTDPWAPTSRRDPDASYRGAPNRNSAAESTARTKGRGQTRATDGQSGRAQEEDKSTGGEANTQSADRANESDASADESETPDMPEAPESQEPRRRRMPSSTWQPLVNTPFQSPQLGPQQNLFGPTSPANLSGIPHGPTTGIGTAPLAGGNFAGGNFSDFADSTRPSTGIATTGVGGVGSPPTTGLVGPSPAGIGPNSNVSGIATGMATPATGTGSGYPTMPSGIGQNLWMPNQSAMPLMEHTGRLPRYLRTDLPQAPTPGTAGPANRLPGAQLPGVAQPGPLQAPLKPPTQPSVSPNYSTSPLAPATPGALPRTPGNQTSGGLRQP